MSFLDFFKQKHTIYANSSFEQHSLSYDIPIPSRTKMPPPFLSTSKASIVATGYEAYFKNGILYDVCPRNENISLDEDRQTAYDAQYIILNNKKYDLENAESISSIAIPRYDAMTGSMPYTTRDLGYILKMRVGKEERPVLAVPLAYKTASIMLASPIAWQKKDYYRLVIQLWSIGEIAYGDNLLQEITKREPCVASDNDIRYIRDVAFDRELAFANDFKKDYLVTEHNLACCSVCAPFRSRVFCISGKDKRFPKLPDFVLKNKGLHCPIKFYAYQYCNGDAVTVYTYSKNGEIKGKKVDAIIQSNRPFIDDRSEFEKEKYLDWKEADDKRAMHDKQFYDRNIWIQKYNSHFEYYEIKTKLGEKAPKSFSGYMKMKRNNSVSFQKLVKLATDMGISIS